MAIIFIELTIKKHSMIVTTSNYHINVIYIKLNETVKDPEVEAPIFDPQWRMLMMYVIVKTTFELCSCSCTIFSFRRVRSTS